MTSTHSWFTSAVTELADPQNQRVWSIIVSLFGDMAQERSAKISGGALGRIIEPMGIKPEAIRVALHRLRKDGWIESDRIGRVSMHFLTEYGRTQSARVTPRIYAREPAPDSPLYLLIAEDGTGTRLLEDILLSHDYTPIRRNAALGSGTPPRDQDELMILEVTARTVPQWAHEKLFPQDMREACRSLLGAVRHVAQSCPANWEPSPCQVATLRTLIVHRWRRVVLRLPDLPDSFCPPDWTGPACRAQVFRLLDRLPRPLPDDLNDG